MDILFDKLNVNQSKLTMYLTRRVASELNALTEPCYFPALKKDYYELLGMMGLTHNDIKEFIKRLWHGRKEEKFSVHNVPDSMVIIILMYYYLNNDPHIFPIIMRYFCIRYYMNTINKAMSKYCNPDVFRRVFQHLSKTHLIVREGSISNFIVFISKEMETKYANFIKMWNVDQISSLIIECRTRISQSVKSFAEIYYKVTEEKTGHIRSHEERMEDEEGTTRYETVQQSPYIKYSEELAKKICLYKIIDNNAKLKAQNISKLNINNINKFLLDITQLKHLEIIKIIFVLFIKKAKEESINICNDSDLNNFIKYLITLKRTTDSIYYKQQISILIKNIFNNNSSHTESLQLLNFIGYYFAYFIQHNICK